jgi:DNA-directed RNA polymerase subunit RPC12/RpoP
MKYYWCTKCDKPISKNQRDKRVGSKGWVCPMCGIGLPRYPVEIIDERPDLEELLT